MECSHQPCKDGIGCIQDLEAVFFRGEIIPAIDPKIRWKGDYRNI